MHMPVKRAIVGMWDVLISWIYCGTCVAASRRMTPGGKRCLFEVVAR
jgi:hypothetical protein